MFVICFGCPLFKQDFLPMKKCEFVKHNLVINQTLMCDTSKPSRPLVFADIPAGHRGPEKLQVFQETGILGARKFVPTKFLI